MPISRPPESDRTATPPDLSGPLAGLRIADADDLPRYKAAVAAGGQMGWGYYFPYLLTRNDPGRSAVLLGEDDGSTCVFLWERRDGVSRLDVYLPPTPMSVPVLERCVERANDFNGDRSARVMRIDAKDAGAVGSRLRVRVRRSQYLFAPGLYDDLAGKAFYTVRRNVGVVDRLPDVAVARYTPSYAAGCRALLERWKRMHRATRGTGGGVGTSRRALRLLDTLPDEDLGGEVVLVDGEVAAFAFGGEIRPGLAASFERKCDTGVRGLSYFHFRSFLRSLRGFDLVNDGSDARREGLRQLKQSFRPVEMHEEYRGSQR